MGIISFVSHEPWVVAVLGVALLIFGLLSLIFLLKSHRGREVRAWVSAVGRSAAIRIDVGKKQGLKVGQILIVYRSIVTRRISECESVLGIRRFVPIGHARVMTVGTRESLCHFVSEAGMSSAARAGDFVSNQDWNRSGRMKSPLLAA